MGILQVHTWYIYTQGPECAGLTEKCPRLTQRIYQNDLQPMKVAVDGLMNAELPEFVDPKIPNSSYLWLVDPKIPGKRSTILQRWSCAQDSVNRLQQTMIRAHSNDVSGDRRYTRLPIEIESTKLTKENFIQYSTTFTNGTTGLFIAFYNSHKRKKNNKITPSPKSVPTYDSRLKTHDLRLMTKTVNSTQHRT